MDAANRHSGPRSLFYTAEEVAELFEIAPKTVYNNKAEFGGEKICGALRFAKNRIHLMLQERGALVPA